QPHLDGMRVLVVDDNPINREILSKQLGAWGAAVETAADPETVVTLSVAAARVSKPFAVAVLDHAMPGLDGLSLARLIRAEPALAGMRLILATSSPGHQVENDAAACGIVAVLAKPCPPSTLLTALASPPEARAAASGMITPTVDPVARAAIGAGMRVLVAED